MAILPILNIHNNESELREPSELVPDSFFRTHKLEIQDVINNMIDTMVAEGGVGIAAPQIGYKYKIIILRPNLMYPNKKNMNPFYVCINPTYKGILKDGSNIDVEACLSVPGKFGYIERFNNIIFEHKYYPIGNLPHNLNTYASRVIQHECLPRRSLIITEDGTKTIGEIVDSKYSGNVLALDNNSNYIYSKITGWKSIKNSGKKKWIKLKFSNTGANQQLTCTEDHICAYVDNILDNPIIMFDKAKNMIDKYLIRIPNIRKSNSEHNLYNNDQISFIIGGLLGDTSISSRGEVLSNHGGVQKEYAQFKVDILGGTLKRSYSGYKKEWSNWLAYSPITEQTKLLRKMCYFNRYKSIENIIDLINDKSLAVWYMDDGNLKNGKTVRFHTEGFKEYDVDLLIKMLETKFNIIAKKYKRKIRGNIKYIIALGVCESVKLFNIISPYIHDSMLYKLPSEFIVEKYNFNINKLNFSCRKVKNILERNIQSKLYDISVENTHTFFADNTFVHNCDHLEGVLYYDRTLFGYDMLQNMSEL